MKTSSTMKATLRWCVALTAVAALSSAAYAQRPGAGQAPPAAQEPAARDQAPITGELTRVSPDTKMFSVKSAAGAEMQFRYNDQTIVTGAQKTVAGLATASGNEVTVTFRVEGNSNMATKIEVREKK